MANTVRYVVKRGDTLFRIARRFGVNFQALVSANPQLSDPDVIVPGEVIFIPRRGFREYVVQPGDSLYHIARAFSVSLQEVVALNPHINPNVIYPGQIIYLPDATRGRIVEVNQEYGYDEMLTDLRQLQAACPILEVRDIGQSVEGRRIPAIRLGRGGKEVFYSAAYHANEWLTTPVLMRFIEDYCQAYQNQTTLSGYNIRELFSQTSIWLVPLVNPDGVELVIEGISPTNPHYESVVRMNNGSTNFHLWKANIRGVDLNDQFPAGWEEEVARRPEAPGPRDYPGPSPLSEPESQAIASFTGNHDFRLVLAYHSQGEVIYWGYEGMEPAEAEPIVTQFSRISGYTPIRYVESDAGYKDWFIQEYRRPGYTVEIGKGTNPLPISQFPSIYEKNLGMLLYAATV